MIGWLLSTALPTKEAECISSLYIVFKGQIRIIHEMFELLVSVC